MPSIKPALHSAAALIMLAVLAGCGDDEYAGGDPVIDRGRPTAANSGGYDKVVDRGQPTIAMASHPEPPPVVAGAAGGAATAPIIAANLPAGVTQEMVNQGQELYGTVCVACHGANGVGSPAAPALDDNQWLWVPGGEYNGVVNIINVGVPQPKQYPGLMPPKGGGSFTDEQVRAISAYVYALSHQGGA